MTLPRLTVPPPATGVNSPLPQLGPAPPPTVFAWKFIQRYTIRPAAVDTSSFGDIPLPVNGYHAMIIWIARDTSAGTGLSSAGMQLGINGGAIDTAANYFWSDANENTVNAGAVASNNSTPSASSWGAFWTSNGGNTAGFWARGTIWLPFYNDPPGVVSNHEAIWHLHVGQGGQTFSIEGGGWYQVVGNITKVRMLSSNTLAAGTTFDLFAVVP